MESTSECTELERELNEFFSTAARSSRDYGYGRPALVDTKEEQFVTPLGRNQQPSGLNFFVYYAAFMQESSFITSSEFWYGESRFVFIFVWVSS